MKKLMILPVLALSANALAASLPTILPDGEYKMSCQDVEIRKMDKDVPNQKPVADADGLIREVSTQTGNAIFLTDGDQSIIKEVYDNRASADSFKGEDTTTMKIKDVGNGEFEIDEAIAYQQKYENGEVENGTQKVKFKTRVQGNARVNIWKALEGGPETPSTTEAVMTEENRVYRITSYNREPVHIDSKKLDNGASTIGFQLYQSLNTCEYTSLK
jgi:hypothetical protein